MDEVFLTYDVIRGQIIPRLDDLESFVYWSCTSKHYNSAFSCQLPPQLRDEALRRVSPKKLIAKQGWLHLREEQFVHLCDRVQEVFSREPTLLEIEGPIVVVGDIHGQWHDLVTMFSLHPSIPLTKYLFLGDYVNRGGYGYEVLVLLFSLKLVYPRQIFLLRGNHEARQITQVYGFYDQMQRRYGSPTAWGAACNAFDYLPLAAVINQKMFCVHGGLSPQLDTLDHIRQIDRVQEIPYDGPISDLVWTDPDDRVGWGIVPKGAGYLFGEDVLHRWNHMNNLTHLFRAHQLVMDGYDWKFNKTLCTIFSAPNYCYRCGNLGAILSISDNSEITEMTYEWTPLSEKVKFECPEYFL